MIRKATLDVKSLSFNRDQFPHFVLCSLLFHFLCPMAPALEQRGLKVHLQLLGRFTFSMCHQTALCCSLFIIGLVSTLTLFAVILLQFCIDSFYIRYNKYIDAIFGRCLSLQSDAYDLSATLKR